MPEPRRTIDELLEDARRRLPPRVQPDSRRYGANHDTIFFYTPGKQWTWNKMFLPYSEDYIEQNYRYRDADGRRFRVSDMTANKPGGDVSYEWTTPGGMKVKPYKGRYWAYSKENMQQMHDAGLIYYRTTGMPMLKHYLDEMPGVPLQTFWDDIKPVISGSEERQRPGCISSIEWCKSAAQKNYGRRRVFLP